jgi:CBS domain-containing protein
MNRHLAHLRSASGKTHSAVKGELNVNGTRPGIPRGVDRFENEGGAMRAPRRRAEQAIRIATGECRTELLSTQTPISEVMERNVVCVEPELSIEALMALFLDRGLSGAPVVDRAGKLIGMVSSSDVLRELQDRGDVEERVSARARKWRSYGVGLATGFHVTSIARATVGEIMTPLAIALHETASVAQAIALIAMKGVHRIPIVGSNGKVIGIVCAVDAMCCLARKEGHPPSHPSTVIC